MSSISLLLGAGFSVNAGYPTASKLNRKITSLRIEDFDIYSDGTLFWYKGEGPRISSNPRANLVKEFSIALIHYYNTQFPFDYEHFFDFYRNDGDLKENVAFQEFFSQFKDRFHVRESLHELLHQHNSVYNQIIAHFLVDKNGRQYPEPVHICKPIFPKYTGVLNCLESWGNNSIVNVHTLNHDMFFERLKDTDWLSGDLSDGFEKLGSPYYGGLKLDGETFEVRLKRYTGEYNGTYRLYKLHGSLDQVPFHVDGYQDNYIKINKRVGLTELYKEVTNQEGNLEVKHDFFSYHADFLTGTSSKIIRYKEPFYSNLFHHFEENLKEAEKLVIIGYGCRDEEVNNIIASCYEIGKPVFLVEPFPHEDTYRFCKERNIVPIEKTPDDLALADFE